MSKTRFNKNKLHSFAKNEKGSFAILFGLMAAIAIFAVGMGIDYARATGEQNLMQKALDAAVLSGTAQSQTISDEDEIEQAALDIFNANYQPVGGTTLNTVSFDYNATERVLSGTITGVVPTTLSRVLGRQTIDVGVTSTARLGVTQIEYILSVDQSGSMLTNGRQEALEDGLEVFGQTLQDTLQFGDRAFVGLVPWQTTVNIGTQRRDWVLGLDRPLTDGLITPFNNNEGDPNNLEFTTNTQRENVLGALSTYDFNIQGFSGYDAQATFQSLDTNTFISQGNNPNIVPADYPDLSWRGCVMARDVDATIPINPNQDFDDFADTENSANLAAPFEALRVPDNDVNKFRVFYQPPHWGTNGLINTWVPFGNNTQSENDDTRNPNLGCIRQEMNYFINLGAGSASVLQNVINGLDPDDDVSAHTDTSLGVAWALRMLNPAWRSFWDDPSLPVSVPATFNGDARKVIILLTDGRNGIGSGTLPETRSAYGDASLTLNSTLTNNNLATRNRATDILNLRTLRYCQLAKNLGIEVYTIGLDLNSGNANIQEVIQMLDNCASEPTASVPDYSILATPDNLADAFESIARQERDVRLVN